MEQTGIPKHETTLVQELIKYNANTKQWECTQCEQKENTQDKRNIIQHALRKHKQASKSKNILAKINPEQMKTIQARIETLIKIPDYNITLTEPEKTNTNKQEEKNKYANTTFPPGKE